MPKPSSMYSMAWFETFASNVSTTIAEVDGISRALPPSEFSRVLELGCGTGRIVGPLARRGYDVVGIDVNVDALITANRCEPGPRYVALDRVDVGAMGWRFDAALVVWSSLGFAGRASDVTMLAAVFGVLRPGGRLVLDLYHPAWLAAQEERAVVDPRGATIRRWLRDRRLFHEIVYADGRVDDIQFDVYLPEAMAEIAQDVGFDVARAMSWWDPEADPTAEVARYQLVCVRGDLDGVV